MADHGVEVKFLEGSLVDKGFYKEIESYIEKVVEEK